MTKVTLSHCGVLWSSGERMTALWFLFRALTSLSASQLNWVVLCDNLWHSWRVMFKQIRINSWLLGSLCFSGLLRSLSLLCSLDADIWKKFLSRPALPFILRLLRGLAMQHPATQVSSQPACIPYSEDRTGRVRETYTVFSSPRTEEDNCLDSLET